MLEVESKSQHGGPKGPTPPSHYELWVVPGGLIWTGRDEEECMLRFIAVRSETVKLGLKSVEAFWYGESPRRIAWWPRDYKRQDDELEAV